MAAPNRSRCVDQRRNVVIWNEQTAARNRRRCGTYDRMVYSEMNSHSCRVSYISLHCNSGACRIKPAWTVTRCGRCCIHLIKYNIHSPRSCMVLREKNLYLRFGIWDTWLYVARINVQKWTWRYIYIYNIYVFYGLVWASPPQCQIGHNLYLAGRPNERREVWGSGAPYTASTRLPIYCT